MSSELPQGWASARLGDLVEPIEVADPTRTPDAVFRYIDIGSIDNEALRIGEPKTFSGKDAPSRARRVVRDGDVLFSTVRPYLRNIALASVAHSGCLTSTGISVLRAKPSVLPGYLFRLVSSNAFVEEVGRSMDGTLYPAVRDSDVLAASIPLPPLAEQRRIVERIDALFARTRRARTHLERIAPLAKRFREQSIARATQPERDDEWPVLRVAEIAHVVTGTTPPTTERGYYGGDTPFMKPTDLDAGFHVSSARASLTASGVRVSRLVPAGSTLLTCIGATIGKAGFARVDCTTNQQINALVPNRERVDERWLYWAVTSPAFQNAIQENASATTLPILNKGRLERLSLPVASLECQRLAANALERRLPVGEVAEGEAERVINLLKRLEQSILIRAFRGELVPQDPNDEPASILLEQIKSRGEAEGEESTRKRGQQPNRSEEKLMKDKPLPARDQLLKDSEKWPKTGLPFEAIAKRNFMHHDTLRDALFELLSGPSPALQQRFDSEAEIMLIQRVAA